MTRTPHEGAHGLAADAMQQTVIDGQHVFAIAGVDQMQPFLMTLVSATDHWMFISSTGGLTAGRVRPQDCLFPYETEDRLHRGASLSGPVTLVRVDGQIWEPFTAPLPAGAGARNVYRTPIGHRIGLEEVRPDLGLTFRYQWSTTDLHGFIRTATLVAHAGAPVRQVEILDGFNNVMPADVELGTWQRASVLVDAYRRSERHGDSSLAMYSLEARISDRAEPAQALRANVVWSPDLGGGIVSLSADAIASFRRGNTAADRPLALGEPGAYLVDQTLILEPGDVKSWRLIADVGLDHAALCDLASALERGSHDAEFVQAIAEGQSKLVGYVARADGLQCTADSLMTAHHQMNVLFNNMRGGIFADGESIQSADFRAFVAERDTRVFEGHLADLDALPDRLLRADLMDWASAFGDPNLLRLTYEYLPLTFGRRHGDPSRPWNLFEIILRDSDGSPRLDYQGNWRDVFQNWEALLQSHPGFIENAVARFVNASTVDGFNPYHVSRSGFDWESPDPDDAWSNIGYWGDHQIIYLLKLLEASQNFNPAALPPLLDARCFSYADVPYRLVSYASMLESPKETIDFCDDTEAQVTARVSQIGGDGRLRHDTSGRVVHVTLTEKLVVTMLCKLCNLVEGGGIWMNTQRPEWNDANNALVGNGVSMVTALHLRRFVAFFSTLLANGAPATARISVEVADWMAAVVAVLEARPDSDDPARRRRTLLDGLGQAFEAYRATVYNGDLSEPTPVPLDQVAHLCELAQTRLDQTAALARRADGLFHSYSLVEFSEGLAELRSLQEMLEGQVAVLGTDLLDSDDALTLVEQLFSSRMYRPDQHTFMLYPNVPRPSMLERNRIGQDGPGQALLEALADSDDRSIVRRDRSGGLHFAAALSRPSDLVAALEQLRETEAWVQLIDAQGSAVQQRYADVFETQAFTGRSNAMYKYEGLGCIYWHMVSKLVVAVGERALAARDRGEPVDRWVQAWHRVRRGLSPMKSPREYGAFPIDPYSHTPAHLGAQQPGMTGQVKEGVLIRLAELGVRVVAGRLTFDPFLLRRREFLSTPAGFTYRDVADRERTVVLPVGSLAFTVCQVPVIYHVGARLMLRVSTSHGNEELVELGAERSAQIFGRSGEIRRIDVEIPASMLLTEAV